MNSPQTRMTHCPQCSKPLLNGAQFWGVAEFCLRCPSCHTDVIVSIQTKITATVKQQEQEETVQQVPAFHSP